METDQIFHVLEVVNGLGRTLQIDDIKDAKYWLKDLAKGRLHHGFIGFMLEQSSIIAGLGLIGHVIAKDQYPVTYNSSEEALKKLIEEVSGSG